MWKYPDRYSTNIARLNSEYKHLDHGKDEVLAKVSNKMLKGIMSGNNVDYKAMKEI